MSASVWEWKMRSPGGLALGLASLMVEIGLACAVVKWRNRR